MLSLGLGRTTCSYFLPGDSTIVYASTHLEDAKCPHVPDRRVDGKYVGQYMIRMIFLLLILMEIF